MEIGAYRTTFMYTKFFVKIASLSNITRNPAQPKNIGAANDDKKQIMMFFFYFICLTNFHFSFSHLVLANPKTLW